MSLVVTDDNNYKAIADTIRSYLYEPDRSPMKPSEMPERITRAVADQTADAQTAGYSQGYAEGKESGIADGKKSEYDRFWDSFQDNGNRRNYQYGFAGVGWNDETFKPKYDIIVSAIPMRMFVNARFTNLSALLEGQGVVLDTSGTTNVQYLFDSCTEMTEAPNIVCNANATALFSYCEKMVTASITVNASTVFSNTFNRCNELVNLTVNGTIGQNGFSTQYSTKLSKASITSVVNALSTTTSGLSITLSKTSVNNAFTDAEWSTLAGTKTNWTINLV